MTDDDDDEEDSVVNQAMASLNGQSVQNVFGVNSARKEEDGAKTMSLSPSSLAHLWAMVGLLVSVNIVFCLYRVCRSESKTRYISESDHVADDLQFQD